ncbi:DNA topology modulation protein [Planococcus sp. YIM B11945]|uniref:DNA topology modulation protein n=1 Tax=Planococcus sp. YIM B11945 TaxID=3435410 RepID=UPI003D7E70FD
MKRIAIIGSVGSGKSTLARKLGNKLNIEVFHLDALFWKAGWQATSKEEQRNVQIRLVERQQWIIDGNYNGTMDIRLNAADTIIFLDFNRILCTYRILKRMIRYRNKPRPDMAEGIKERFDVNFVKWVWRYPKTNRPLVLSRIDQLKETKTIIVLKTPHQAKRFLDAH